MKNCCSENKSEKPGHSRCPVNGKLYKGVAIKTILHHLSKPWDRDLKQQEYFFCSDVDCEVVYFGKDESLIKKSELRSQVGVKETAPTRKLCYCFDINFDNAKQDGKLVEFVKNKTQRSLCSCETSNPSGKCCLKDFPVQ